MKQLIQFTTDSDNETGWRDSMLYSQETPGEKFFLPYSISSSSTFPPGLSSDIYLDGTDDVGCLYQVIRLLSPRPFLQVWLHTPSIAFRHLPPNSARFSYATEGALFISAQLSTDAVSALRKVWVKDVVNQCLEFESGHR